MAEKSFDKDLEKLENMGKGKPYCTPTKLR